MCTLIPWAQEKKKRIKCSTIKELNLLYFLVNRSIFTVSLCYLLFNNFTFLKDQYTMVEYNGVLDVISETFRSVGT